MHFASHYLRVCLLSLVSVGMIVPAWATQPCQCQANGDCCERHSSARSCCDKKPCCAQHSIAQVAEAPTCEIGCPCCTEASAPTTSAPRQSESTQQEQPAPATIAELPPTIPPVASTAYLTRGFESPPGHPALPLHALYRVWLN